MLIRTHLEKILASPGFVNSTRMRQFLQLIVENSLSGGGPLKETVIGVRVFGRAPDYDSSLEPIVRVEARRLRQKLQQYYDRGGAGDPLMIVLPKGGYTPEFEVRTVIAATAVAVPGPVLPEPERVPHAALPLAPIPVLPQVPADHPPERLRHGLPPSWAWAAAALCCLAAIAIWVAEYRPVARPIASISVLPLANLSGDPSEEYLADGMTDELIGSLARITSLRVISRTSAMRYKGVSKPLPQIAKELNVDVVVEGSVTRSGREVRITAQLIDGRTDRHLWSGDYNRPVDDLLAVQGEVARAIAQQVTQTLSGNFPSPAQGGPAEAGEAADIPAAAYEAYLKGRYFWNKRTPDGLRTSIDFFHQALAQAPQYARAWAGLADSYLLLGEAWTRPAGESYAKAREAADKALELNPELGEAHATRAALEANLGRWDQAEPEFRHALRLSPGSATAHQWYAERLASHGRTNEALEEIRRARELDPLSLIVIVQVGYIDFLARRYDEAISEFRAAIQMDPNFYFAHADLGAAYEEKKMYAEAIVELQKAADLTNRGPSEMMWLGRAWALAGRREDALHVRGALEQDFEQGRIPASCMALLDLALGDRERALERLQRACSADVVQPLAAPQFDVLRADARIAPVVARCRTAD